MGLETSIQRLMFCSIQSSWECNSPILSCNIIYTRIQLIWLLSVSYYVHSASTYVTYWVSYSRLFLHYRWYCRHLSWDRGTDFLTAASVYEHFDTAVFWLRVSYSFFTVYFGCECMRGPLSIDYVYVHIILFVYIWMEFSLSF